jgi:peptide/nickel transport system substrate-binding protein
MPTTWAAHGPVVNANFAARVAYSIYDQLVRRDYLSGPGGGGIELVPGLATS